MDATEGRAVDDTAAPAPTPPDTADADIEVEPDTGAPEADDGTDWRPGSPHPACPEGMAYVPAGPFVMGMEVGPGHAIYASRRQVVDLPAFCIGTLEVTNEDYRRCEARGLCRAPRLSYGPDAHPVVGVTWNHAAAYCESVGRRLPTAAEWEKAARGGCEIVEPSTCGPEDERRYPWGDDDPTCDCANYRGCTRDGADEANGRASGASPYGVLQLLGNAAEWVEGLEGYDRIAGFDEGDDAAHDGVERASYGCSWFCDADGLDISGRDSSQPRSDDRFQGLRCAATVEPLRSVEVEWAPERRARAVQQPGSGLWWLSCSDTPPLEPYCGESTWAEASAVCPPGWRLPMRFELVALLGGFGGCSREVLASGRSGTCGSCEANATCRAVLGPSRPPAAWTSTTAGEGRAWTVSIADGVVGPEPTGRSHAVPCVHDGPPPVAANPAPDAGAEEATETADGSPSDSARPFPVELPPGAEYRPGQGGATTGKCMQSWTVYEVPMSLDDAVAFYEQRLGPPTDHTADETVFDLAGPAGAGAGASQARHTLRLRRQHSTSGSGREERTLLRYVDRYPCPDQPEEGPLTTARYPSHTDVHAKLEGVREAVHVCAGGQPGTAVIAIRFEGSSGRVLDVEVSGDFTGPAATCIADVIRGVTLTSFPDSSSSVTYTYRFQPSAQTESSGDRPLE
ncbi:MAG: formylglycine-generating enzyme family protein [Deltaproteobacteria bacterium]|nr:formylglycine-generating enzyme family protein [Deltaproteobacteria bacterium]